MPDTQTVNKTSSNLPFRTVHNPYAHKIYDISVASMVGFDLEPEAEAKLKLPVFWEDGRVFGSEFVFKSEKIATLPGDIRKGTYVHYLDKNKKEWNGVVIEPWLFAKYKGIYVAPVAFLEKSITHADIDIQTIHNVSESDFLAFKEAVLENREDQIRITTKNPLLRHILIQYYEIRRILLAAKIFTIETFLWIFLVMLIAFFSIIIIVYSHK